MKLQHKIWLWTIFTIACILLAGYTYLTTKEAETQQTRAANAILRHYLTRACNETNSTVTSIQINDETVTWTLDCGLNGNQTNTEKLDA